MLKEKEGIKYMFWAGDTCQNCEDTYDSSVGHYVDCNEHGICDDCWEQFICTICRDPVDYCQGHSPDEQKEFGDCPVCDYPVDVGAESLIVCQGHTFGDFYLLENGE